MSAAPAAADPALDPDSPRERFVAAWQAARDGDRQTFERLGPTLGDYLLYPYWQYEDYRFRRSVVPAAEMAAFLEAHADWAFAEPLRNAWVKSLGEHRRWREVNRYGGGIDDTVIRCYYARSRLELGDTDGLLPVARELWTVGHSQPKECDPLFTWLVGQGGVTPEVAWERIRLAMRAGNPRFTLYLARFLPEPQRVWLQRWQELNHSRYRKLARLAGWPDTAVTRMITGESLRRLARHDAVAAMQAFAALDGHFDWGAEQRGLIMRDIALMAAVDLEPAALAFLHQVPEPQRDDQLLQWWTRLALAQGDWNEVAQAIGQLSGESAGDHRWAYWQARAWMATGRVDQGLDELRRLATEANYYGFLAADDLGEPYTICPQEPQVAAGDVERLQERPDFGRALELHEAGIENWAQAEWSLATRRLSTPELRAAAALALDKGWNDRAIFALGDSGDLRYYEWRFPVLWPDRVTAEAGRQSLDPAWILGVMRAESAMTETARSSASALGLMQLTPGTARQLAKRHGLTYQGTGQLLSADANIRFGSAYLRELLDRYGQNPVLVSAAYNAGPDVTDSWLRTRTPDEAAIWIETLPYYETRDYIPRVLAFTTIYDWRLRRPVPRVSSRMPGIESGNMRTNEATEVVCRVPEAAELATSP